jgi:penicillin-binding protein 1C
MKKKLKHVHKKLKKQPRKKLIIFGLIFIFLALFYFAVLKDLPLPTKLGSYSAAQTTQILDRNGKLLYNIYDKRNQSFIPLNTMPLSMQQATVAIEDKGFYQHGAIDLKGISRAIISNLLHKKIQGGSTLTQQLVKNSLLSQEQTIMRKVKEVILAFASEIIYSKKQILEMYLNQTPYGGPAYGIEAASQTFFGKHAKDLTLAQSALLAGLPQSPTAFSPFGAHPELAKQRQIEVLKAMKEAGYINQDQEQKAIKEDLKYAKISNSISAPHFVLYIKDLLTAKYGEKAVSEGGLKVTTSLDLDIQNYAQASVAAEVNDLPKWYHVTNGAAMVVVPGTGEILAMVGSKNYFDTSIDGNVNITTSLRQPGSSIKPINYAAGLGNGYNAGLTFIDEPVCFPNQGGKDYCPLNYDLKWHGLIQMRNALGNSFNIPAVKMLKLNGINTLIATASAMGITSFTHPENYGLALTLGGAEVKMVDMTQAFSVFANQGYLVKLHPILKIIDKNGKNIENYTPPASPIFGKKVMSEGIAFIISDILADNNARLLEFGENSALKIKNQTVSVKTGTTNDYKDNWTIGYTPSYLVAAWVGNNDNTPMSGLVSGITGAAPIWNDIMSHLLKNKPQEPITRPLSIIQKQICIDTGFFPSMKEGGDSCPTRLEYFEKGTEVAKGTLTKEATWVDKTTQNLPAKDQKDNLEAKDETIFTDATGDKYCITCPHPTPTPSVTPHP